MVDQMVISGTKPSSIMNFRYFTRLLVMGFVLVFASTVASAKETLIIGVSQFPASFHPNFESMLAKYYALNLTVRPITTYDKNWEIVCMLCTRLPTLENGGAKITNLGDGKQGVSVTYTLHPEARWGDGTPVTTKDLEYTIEVGKHPQSGVLGAEFYRRVLSVDVHDDKTFTLNLDRVDFKFNELGLYLIPEHIDRKNFSEPEHYRTRNAYDNDTYNPGLYFGPYRVVEVESGSYIEFARNDSWWGESPHFETIVIRTIENTAALEANLLSGSIDYIAGVLGVTLVQALALENRYGEKFDFVFHPGLVYEHIDLNLDNPILADIRVRKALIHAIDRQSINSQLFEGKQPVADVYVNPLDATYDDSVPHYEFNPQKSRQLLEQAGWNNVIDGVRHNDNGEPLRLDFGTTAGSRGRETIQQILHSQWKDVGVDIRIHNEPARVFFGETVSKRKFTGLAMFAWISVPENSPRTVLHSSEIPTLENNWQGSNYTGFRNPKMDEWIDAVEITLDPKERQKLWSKIQHLYASELPVLPLYFRSNPYIIPKWLKGIEPTGNTATTTLWVENWSFEQ